MTHLFRRWAVVAFSLLTSLLPSITWSKECLPPYVPPTEAALSAAVLQAQDRGFLWKISKEKTTSYLYGTMHLGRLDWWALGPRVAAALENSAILALELDLSNSNTASQLMQGMRSQKNDPRPPPDLLTRLRRQAEAECLDWRTLEPLRPEFQLNTVMVMSARRHQLEAAYGAETMLTAMAQRQGKPIVGLETVDEQIVALRAANPTELREMLESGLKALEAGHEDGVLPKLAKAWADRDATVLQTYEKWCDCVESENERAMSRRLLDDRNLVLADRIEALHGRGRPIFAAVGALHLFGSNNLPELMKARGFRVESVF